MAVATLTGLDDRAQRNGGPPRPMAIRGHWRRRFPSNPARWQVRPGPGSSACRAIGHVAMVVRIRPQALGVFSMNGHRRVDRPR
jgi:hypothetical protein